MSGPTTRQPLDLIFVIDPIGSLRPGHDTSVALMESAQARGHRILVTTMSALGVRNGRATALCTPVRLRAATLRGIRWHAPERWFDVSPAESWALDDADAVFVRTDPPVDGAYLRATFILDLVDQRHTLMINSPAGLRHANEKLFADRKSVV